MVAVAGGNDIPLVPYDTFGTDELAQFVATGLAQRNACLMANHGQIAIGANLGAALELAHEIEVLAEQYVKVWRSAASRTSFPRTRWRGCSSASELRAERAGISRSAANP